MNGLAIRIDRSLSPDPATGQDANIAEIGFAHLFSPILDFVAKLYWITLHCESSPFANAMAGVEAFDQIEGLRIDVEGVAPDLGIQLWRPPALEQFGVHVRNDWQDFLGVKSDRDPLEATRRFADLDERFDFGSDEWGKAFAVAIEEETEIVFFSSDAGVWEVYTAEDRLWLAVLESCKDLGERVHVRTSDLDSRDQVLSALL